MRSEASPLPVRECDAYVYDLRRVPDPDALLIQWDSAKSGAGCVRAVTSTSSRRSVRVTPDYGWFEAEIGHPRLPDRSQDGRSPASVTRCITRRKPW